MAQNKDMNTDEVSRRLNMAKGIDDIVGKDFPIWRSGNYFATEEIEADGKRRVYVGKLTGPKESSFEERYGTGYERYPVLRKPLDDPEVPLSAGHLYVAHLDAVVGNTEFPVRNEDSESPQSPEDQKLYDEVRNFRMKDDPSYTPGPRKNWRAPNARRRTERKGLSR